MKKTYGIYGGISAAFAFAMVFVLLPMSEIETTGSNEYVYTPGAFPPPDPLSMYSDQFVDSIEEASSIVGYEIDTPKFPDGVEIRLIGILDDRIVQIYASPNKISKDTLDIDFLYKHNGVVVHYEKPPARINPDDLPQHIARWADRNDAQSQRTVNGMDYAVKSMHKGYGHEGAEFDLPGELVAEKNGIKIVAKGFLSDNQLRSIVSDF